MQLTRITSATTTTLIDTNVDFGAIRHITIANCHASNDLTIRLFYSDGTNDTSIVENLVIPGGCTLLLGDAHDISFDNSFLSLKLQTAGTSPDCNVIIT